MSSAGLLSQLIMTKVEFSRLRYASVVLNVARRSCAAQRNYSKKMDDKKCLNIENLNPNIKVMEYAVRGPLVIRATEIEKELQKVRDLLVITLLSVLI